MHWNTRITHCTADFTACPCSPLLNLSAMANQLDATRITSENCISPFVLNPLTSVDDFFVINWKSTTEHYGVGVIIHVQYSERLGFESRR